MNLTEQQVQDLIDHGGTVTEDDGEQITIPADAPADTGNKALLGIIGQLMGQLKQAPPVVNVAPPPPAAAPAPPAAWDAIIERDKDGRMSRVRFEPWRK